MGGRGSSGGRSGGGGGTTSASKTSQNTTNGATEYKFEKSELEQLPLNILQEMRTSQINKSKQNRIEIESKKQYIQIDEFIIKDKKLNAEEENRSLYKGEIEHYIERMKDNKKKLAQARKDAKVLYSNIVHIERQIKKKNKKRH